MEGLICLTDVSTVALLERIVHAIHFLLISNKMLYSSSDTLLLQTANRLPSPYTLKNGIRSEAFPVASALWLPAQRTDGRAKPDVDALPARFFTYGYASLIHELLVEGGTGGDTVREDGDIVSLADAVGSIIETQLRKSKTRNRACVAVAPSGRYAISIQICLI